jgi:hypothetical protein
MRQRVIQLALLIDALRLNMITLCELQSMDIARSHPKS